MRSPVNVPNHVNLWLKTALPAGSAVAALGFCLAFAHAAPQPVDLEAGFRSPPHEARPQAWWHWINGNVSKEGIEADLIAIKEAGLSGVQLLDANPPGGLPAGPVRYGSKEWHDLVQYAIRTAHSLGLDFTLMNCPGWSTSGGPWITAEQSMKRLTWSETPIDVSSQSIRVFAAAPPAKLDFYRDIALLAIPASDRRLKDWQGKALFEKDDIPKEISGSGNSTVIAKEKVRDLTEASGLLSSDSSRTPDTLSFELSPGTLPPGKWTLLRIGYTTTGKTNHPAQKEGTGLEVDKMDSDAVQFHFTKSLDQILSAATPQAVDGVLIDSWEAGKQNWTRHLPEEFHRLRGYDLRPWLPALAGYIIGSEEETEAVLRDFRLTVSEMVAAHYFETMQAEARSRNLSLHAEPYHGTIFNEFISSVPVDEVMTEFWVHGARLDEGTKEIASFVHTTGKDRLSAEAFTSRSLESGSWLETPSILKPIGDRAFALGINRLVLHSIVHQPREDLAPGLTLGQYGSHFGRLETWWPLARGWVDYLARCQWLLQQGRFVGDVLFLQTDEVMKFKPRVPTLPAGYDFDGLHPSQMANLRVETKTGNVYLPESLHYRAILLPDKWRADLTTLRELKRLSREGAKIFGARPERPASLLDNKTEWLNEVNSLWITPSKEGPSAGPSKGISSSPNFSAWLETTNIKPDIVITSPDFPSSHEDNSPDRYRRWYFPTEYKKSSPTRDDIRHIHRRTKQGEDIYFIASMSPVPVRITATFRDADSRRAEIWDPVTTNTAIAPIQRVRPEGEGEINLTLEAGGSVFVIFRHTPNEPSQARWQENVFPRPSDMTANGQQLTAIDRATIRIESPWVVKFQQPGNHATPFERHFPQLMNWKESNDSQIRFFSGLADYQTTFELPESFLSHIGKEEARVRLSLGELFDIASITINGKSAGIIWTRPYELDVTSLVQTGKNSLSIKVANRWPNRLIGDETFSLDAKYNIFANKYGQRIPDALLAELPPWWNDPAKSTSRERQSFSTWRPYTRESPLLDSGLIGPVSLSIVQPVEP